MLKWTVTRKLQSDEAPRVYPHHQLTEPTKTKRKKLSSSRTRKSDSPNKENGFTSSTPIKSDNHSCDPLRDVSNFSPPDKNRRRSNKRYNDRNFAHGEKKKKKRCVDNHDEVFFKPFDLVDSHIEGFCPDAAYYAPTLPTFGAEDSPCLLRNVPPTHLSTSITSLDSNLLPVKKVKTSEEDKVNVSPLVKRLIDLRFCNGESQNNSSFINDLSIDQLVDAILDTTDKEEGGENSDRLQEEENDLNATHEENMLNAEQEGRASTSNDSGFNSNTTKHHEIEADFKCKCNEQEPASYTYQGTDCDRTIINLGETFNERCVDQQVDFTLKRQKCIRRRRPSNKEEAEVVTSSSGALEQTFSLGKNWRRLRRRTRRCLSFENSTPDESVSAYTHNEDVKGTIDLALSYERNQLTVKVIRCQDLYRQGVEGPINAYVKVIMADRTGDLQKRRHGFIQRTVVHQNSSRPSFNHSFRIPICKNNINKRLQIEVWHRDRSCRRSDFLGCSSFTIKNVIKKEISGSFHLLPLTTGRTQNVPVPKENIKLAQSFASTNNESYEIIMSETTNDEIMSIDDIDGGCDNIRKTNSALMNQHQKDADENLFLRYLELDPTEGPDAIPAALQRKATGNKNGRTPFTTTKKLIKVPKSGFGFSVVWTHPPRIERVEKGLPADKAGILPGDYIIFVDKHNVVTMPEIDILNLIRSYGNQVTLEMFRRNVSRNGSMVSVRPAPVPCALPIVQNQHRPSTAESVNTASAAECSKKRLNLPQVTFNAEKPLLNTEEARRKAMYQVLAKEQQYTASLQFAITRFVSALAERKDLISPLDHRLLFQNSEEVHRISEEILECLVPEDGEPQIHLLLKVYHSKLSDIITSYKRYCSGIKKADCILVNKTRNSNSDFVRFLQTPAVPRRRPDITSFIHKPLEHYREILKLFNVILSQTKANHDEYALISKIVQDLQIAYREMTAEAGLMEPVGEGRPLLSVQDLENRLVFTKCKPFVLSKPGRQWIFGGDLGRVEGRSVRQYWTLLFSDLILFAKVSRDRVLFIIEDPLPLVHITDLLFNVRKKANEFRLIVHPGGTAAKSPTIHCGPDLTRTPRKSSNKRCIVLRAPTTELKAVWQNLLQRQICHVNAGMEGSSFSSPLESPDVPVTSSVGTLQSTESLSIRRQTPQCLNVESCGKQKQLDEIIEHKCKQLGKCSSSTKGSAIHLEQWMKGQLGRDQTLTPEEESDCEIWSVDMLRRRTEELMISDNRNSPRHCESRCEELILSDHSPSKSTSPESQVTVRSSPNAKETVRVCQQCHNTCRTNPNAHNSNNNINHSKCTEYNKNAINLNTTNLYEDNIICDEFGRLMLMGFSAVNPAASLVKLDPFSPLPKISVVPPTPDTRSEFRYSESVCSRISTSQLNNNECSPDDSPQDEEQPYHSLSSSNPTLRRFGTVSSLERVGSEETDENDEAETSESEDDESMGIDNRGFNPPTIRGWTARAGAFMSEKMAFFERLGEDYRAGTGFFERYLKSGDSKEENGEEDECENSGATSGEEIWGTPTSGDMDDPLSSNYDTKRSPNGGSLSSDNGDDTELMMDELLMTPPIASANLRGLLPRRTLEPLMEEDSDTCTSSSSSPDGYTPSPQQGNGTGDVADICLTAAEAPRSIQEQSNTPAVAFPVKSTTPRILRSDSYRHIIEDDEDNANFFNRFKSNAKIINVERIPRSRTIKLFEIFYVKKTDRKIHESFPEGDHLIKLFNKEGMTSDDVPTSYSQRPITSRIPKMDGRFWRQLSRRRGSKKSDATA
ncbi:uncharacterized protein LOC116167013 isoform X2 [Photinus pyralis]|uniref:uncharacterized protein LOC116167013 isoform X2 n=1 Tax=Photinus pyralis TaxID=7054 RepID=UPI001266EE38|nr:uncharacterized protein LOC116167013 isoform X2 [Photinus pyralis]